MSTAVVNCVAPVPTAVEFTIVRAFTAAAMRVPVFFEAVVFARNTVTLFPLSVADRLSDEAITRVTLISFPAFQAVAAVTLNPFDAPHSEYAATAAFAERAVSPCMRTLYPNFSFLRSLSILDSES